MPKSENKTKITAASVEDFLNTVADSQRRADCFAVAKMMEKATKSKAKMWGTSIVGFGEYHYVYESGREGDSMLVGFSPRKQNLTLYLMGVVAFDDGKLKTLGKFKHGKGCLYINKLEDIDQTVLKELIQNSIDYLSKKYKK